MAETKISLPDSNASALVPAYPGPLLPPAKNVAAPQQYSSAAVIPVHNTQATIGSVILRTSLFSDQIIFVDNGSPEKPAEGAGAEVITLPFRR